MLCRVDGLRARGVGANSLRRLGRDAKEGFGLPSSGPRRKTRLRLIRLAGPCAVVWTATLNKVLLGWRPPPCRALRFHAPSAALGLGAAGGPFPPPPLAPGCRLAVCLCRPSVGCRRSVVVLFLGGVSVVVFVCLSCPFVFVFSSSAGLVCRVRVCPSAVVSGSLRRGCVRCWCPPKCGTSRGAGPFRLRACFLSGGGVSCRFFGLLFGLGPSSF